jgi:protein-S-isoprenylcysteine O-methyltransferase Ste14
MLMFITGFEDFLNVWANDGAKISIFIFVLSLPVISWIIISLNENFFYNKTQNKFFKRDVPNVIFYAVIFFSMLSVFSFGQLILNPVFDAVIRSLGIFIYLSGVFTYIVFVREVKKTKKETDVFELGFYKLSRNPDLAFLFCIAAGSSLLTLSFLGIIITAFAYLPAILYFAGLEEKELLKLYKKYDDYKDETPVILPDVFKIIKKLIYRKIS